MAGRIRSLKPEILEDEKTAGLSDSAFRLFVSMIVLADDHGNLRAEPRWLEGQVWWARGNPPRLAEILRELLEADLIGFYEVRGQVYAALSGWSRHQRIDNAGKPRVPLPSEGSPIFAANFREPPRIAAGSRSPITDHEHEREALDAPTSLEIFRAKADALAPEHNARHAEPRDPAAELADAAVREINRIAGKNYQATSKAILADCRRLARDKYTAEQVRSVVASKRNWIGDPKMGEQFKPSVLLRPSNFAKYLDDLEAKKPAVRALPKAETEDETVSPLLTLALANEVADAS